MQTLLHQMHSLNTLPKIIYSNTKQTKQVYAKKRYADEKYWEYFCRFEEHCIKNPLNTTGSGPIIWE